MEPREYHERTKHHPGRYAASLGYLDWQTQPDPFRRYDGARSVVLPLPEAPATDYAAMGAGTVPGAPLTLQSISALARYAMGLAAWKCMGDDCWALRCNASSGNLHPTELYLILPPITGISTLCCVAHYAPLHHTLEILAEWEAPFPAAAFYAALTSITWREAWKYGERAFRYTQLDAGHALQAVHVSTRMQGWQMMPVEGIDAAKVDRLLGLDQPSRFIAGEHEFSDLLLQITLPSPQAPDAALTSLLTSLPERFAGMANRLSATHHLWEVLPRIEAATHGHIPALAKRAPDRRAHPVKTPAARIVLERRSARAMDFNAARIDRSDFDHLLASTRTLHYDAHAALVLFVHAVTDLEPGLYLYLRHPDQLTALRDAMRRDFPFTPIQPDLYLLEAGDFRAQAKFISCSQEIASDSAFSLGMLCTFDAVLEEHGATAYKSLHWECGAVGQQLYLEATALGLDATGIGCFLDDVMHRMLGLQSTQFQVLYHLTIGRAFPDTRLASKAPYAERD